LNLLCAPFRWITLKMLTEGLMLNATLISENTIV